jgi:hypothetical protein
VDSRVQERKQRALKKHPLAVKLDINCKGTESPVYMHQIYLNICVVF